MILIGGEQKNQAIKTDGICTCLAASMGMGGGYVPILVFEHRYDEEVRLWNDEVCGTLRTIDACGEKLVLEKYEE